VPLQVDPALLARARSEPEALEHVIATMWPEAFRIAVHVLHDAAMAEDAAQEACAAIARSIPKLRHVSAFPSWAYKITVNAALAARRSRAQTVPLDEHTDSPIPFESADALDLYRAMAQLSRRQRAALLMHYYAGFTSKEIAEAGGLRAATVRFDLMLARRALRKALSVAPFDAVPTTDEVQLHVR